MPERASIPSTGRDHDDLLRTMEGFRHGDADWKDGRTWSLVYYAGEAHHELLKKAHHLFFTENALNPMAFKSLKRMEAEVVQMTASMLHAGPGACGTMTTGGTESILMAVKAARDRARAHKPWIRSPEMVAPRTIHAAFDKAAHYFGVRLRHADIGPDHRADVEAMRRLVNRNTVLLAASAPQYPHGVVDPIAAIGDLATERGLPFHVDACIGGFVLPWVEKLGYPLPRFDFRVPAVTSMSADLHKYGFASKGASVVVYRDMSYLTHQFFVATDWPGGIYVSPSMTGTRAGGPIAAAWASLMAMGESGFLDHTRRAMDAARRLQDGIAAIPGLQVLGPPDATLVTWVSRDAAVDVYAVADQLEARGWSVDRQQRPASVHCTVTSNHLPIIDEYLRDLAAAVAFVKEHPEIAKSGNAAMYGMMAKVPFRGMIKQSVRKVMEGLYGPDALAPDPAELAAQDDGLVARLLQQHGPKLNALLDRFEAAKETFSRRGRGR
jgi:glutamate/tyrosine decarboxylase-like PLP-dependent enzyme